MSKLMTKVLLGSVAAGAMLGAMALADPYESSAADPLRQRNFPCQEDEVLGYAPRFGHDKVGCIHVDELKG